MPRIEGAARRDPALTKIVTCSDWQTVREFVAFRAGFRCQHCHAFVGMHGEADHVIPRRDCAAHGISPFDHRNVQWLCTSCHARKTAREAAQTLNSLKRQGFAKPFRHRRSKTPGRASYLRAAGLMEGPPVP